MASYVPSPTGTSSLNTSPNLRSNLQMVHVQTKRQDFADEKMSQLEEIKSDMNMIDFPETTSYGRPASRGHSLSPSTSLSPIGGISVEHRMISDLRNQLETQASENTRLRQQIESATSRQTYFPSGRTSSVSPSFHHGTVPRSLSDTHVSLTPTVRETVESILARGRKSPIDTIPLHTESATEVLLKKQLSDAKAEISVLNERLKNAESSSDQQKVQFRSAIEELQARLNETIVGRDSVLDLRKKESEGQQKMIAKLQKSVIDLDAVNRQHEKDLLEANHRADSSQQTATSCSAALQQIRSLLSAHQQQQPHSRGSTQYPSPTRPGDDLTRNLPPSHVVRLVEEGLRGRLETIRELERTVADLKRELASVRKEVDERSRALSAENREKLLHVTEDHNKQLESLTERATNARQQAACLQTQLAELQEQSTKQFSLKTMELATVTGHSEALKKEADEERHQSHQKIADLTAELETNRSDMQAARDEISKLQLQLADANLTIQSNKESLSSLNVQLKEEKEKAGDLRSQEGQRLMNLQRELEARSLEVRHMHEMLKAQKVEAAEKLRQKIVEVQCEEQKKAVEKTSQLLADLESQRSENNRLSLELMKKNADLEQSNQSRDSLTTILEETSSKLEELQRDHESLTKQLAEKAKMIDILTQERDHYQQMSVERIKELDSATSLQNRLQSQITEREHEYQLMFQEKINLTQVIESNERINSDARQEKDNLIKLLDEKTKQYEEVKGMKDDLNRKLKVREKRVQSLELEVKTLSEAVKEKHGEVEKVIEGKAGLLEEFKTFQQKMTKLSSEKDILEARYQELEASNEKTKKQLELRIQGLEHDLQLTLQALRATKNADARAVDIAESVQQELLMKRNQVDSLNIRIHGLEESLSAALKEKTLLETEKAFQEEQISKLKEQMVRFQRKLKSLSEKRTSQKDVVTKLEAALEKAALKHTDAQRLINDQEQAIAKMTLRHQLELKALQRTLATRAPSTKAAPNQSSSVSTQRTTTVEKVQTSESATTLTKIQQQSSGKETSAGGGVVANHFLQSASIQAMDGMMKRNYISPIPVVLLNTSGIQVDSHPVKQETLETVEEAHNISSELKDLLEEVKTVFSANMAALKEKHSSEKKPIEPAKDRVTPKTEDVLDPPLLTSSPYKVESESGTPFPPTSYERLHLKKDLELQTPSSPVTNLLGLHGKVRSDSALLKQPGYLTRQVDREVSVVPAVNRTQRQGTTVIHTVSGAQHRVGSTATKSYTVNRPAKHSSPGANVRDNADPTVMGATGSVPLSGHFVSRLYDGSRDTAHQDHVKDSISNNGSDVSVPLRIEVPEPGCVPMGEGRVKGHGVNLEALNQRNRQDNGYGDVEMFSELVISEDDNSSITTVTSYNTDMADSEPPDRIDSLKSLKARLAALTQMGTQLEKGNKEMAGLIKRQDVKLKRCRQEERNAKRIINSK